MHPEQCIEGLGYLQVFHEPKGSRQERKESFDRESLGGQGGLSGGGDVGREQYCSVSVVDGRNLESQHGDFGVGRPT